MLDLNLLAQNDNKNQRNKAYQADLISLKPNPTKQLVDLINGKIEV